MHVKWDYLSIHSCPWCYCNVVDVFTRQWLAFVLTDRPRAIMAVNNAVAAAEPPLGLTLRVDKGIWIYFSH